MKQVAAEPQSKHTAQTTIGRLLIPGYSVPNRFRQLPQAPLFVLAFLADQGQLFDAAGYIKDVDPGQEAKQWALSHIKTK